MFHKKKKEIPRRRQAEANRAKAEQVSEQTGRMSFTRNRTLVGSLSSSVSSVNELGGDLRSPRAHAHHLTAHRRRLGSLLVMVLLAAGTLVWLLYEFTAFIEVSPSDSSLAVDEQRYQSAINEYLASRPGERIRVLLDEKELTQHVSQVAPEVSSVSVDGASGLATSQFTVVFRRPVAGWLINSKQYYVDKDGMSFQTNHYERPTVKIIDQSGVPQTTGTTVASGRFLRFVGRTVELARSSGLAVEQALIPAGTTRQIEIKLANHQYPIKLSLDRSVGEQVEDMQRAVTYFDAKGAKPEYVDVRVSGKAYYR